MNDKPQNDRPPSARQGLQEESLDKLISVLEGPANKIAERIFSSRILLAPMSIGLNLGFRVIARVAGRPSRKETK